MLPTLPPFPVRHPVGWPCRYVHMYMLLARQPTCSRIQCWADTSCKEERGGGETDQVGYMQIIVILGARTRAQTRTDADGPSLSLCRPGTFWLAKCGGAAGRPAGWLSHIFLPHSRNNSGNVIFVLRRLDGRASVLKGSFIQLSSHVVECGVLNMSSDTLANSLQSLHSLNHEFLTMAFSVFSPS